MVGSRTRWIGTGAETRAKLQTDIMDIARRHAAGTFTKEPEPAEREPFGRWLIAQRGRGDWIDDLANEARQDRGFPKNNTP